MSMFLLTKAKEQKINKPLVHAYNLPLFHWRKELSVTIGNSTLIYTQRTATVKKGKQDVITYLFISPPRIAWTTLLLLACSVFKRMWVR